MAIEINMKLDCGCERLRNVSMDRDGADELAMMRKKIKDGNLFYPCSIHLSTSKVVGMSEQAPPPKLEEPVRRKRIFCVQVSIADAQIGSVTYTGEAEDVIKKMSAIIRSFDASV